MPKVTHIEFNSPNPEKTAAFYESVFGWVVFKKQDSNDDYWLAHTGNSSEAGINAGFRKKIDPRATVVPTMVVESLEKATKDVKTNGGSLLGELKTLPGTGRLQYCADPEGNVFTLLERGR